MNKEKDLVNRTASKVVLKIFYRKSSDIDMNSVWYSVSCLGDKQVFNIACKNYFSIVFVFFELYILAMQIVPKTCKFLA